VLSISDITASFGSPQLFLTGKRGSPTALCIFRWDEASLGQTGTAKARGGTSTVAELARFFPEATPVRIPVRLTRSATGDGQPANGPESSEDTVIEFGTSREVLFACTTPLEFADVLRLRNSDGSLDTKASVVAVQYHPGTTVVAARFLTSVPNWIVKS
jgi:hypothetical protein